MQAVVAGLKPGFAGTVVVVVLGTSVVDVVLALTVVVVFSVLVVVVGRAVDEVLELLDVEVVELLEVEVLEVVDVLDVEVLVVGSGMSVLVVVVTGSGMLAQLARQVPNASRHVATDFGFAQLALHVPNAAVVVIRQVLSEWQRGPAVVQEFWQAEPQLVPLAMLGSSQTASRFTQVAAQAVPVPGAKQLANAE
jgi:hypothetical protein